MSPHLTAEQVLAAAPDVSGRDEVPAHRRIARWVEALISSGGLRPGDRLPAEISLAAALGVSRMTLRQALGDLQASGLVESRRGRTGGSFVTVPQLDFDLSVLRGFTEQTQRSGVRAGARLVRAVRAVPPTPVRTALRLSPGADAFEVVRVRSAGRQPIVLEQSFFPAAAFPGLLDRGMSGSMYALLRAYGRPPASAVEVLEPVAATADQARALGVGLGEPLLRVTRTAYTSDGTPVEYAHDHLRGDRARVVLHTHAEQPASLDVQTREPPGPPER